MLVNQQLQNCPKCLHCAAGCESRHKILSQKLKGQRQLLAAQAAESGTDSLQMLHSIAGVRTEGEAVQGRCFSSKMNTCR